MKNRLRIGYVSAIGVNDPSAKSGTNYYLSRMLEKHFGQVIPLGGFRPSKVSKKWVLHHLGSSLAVLYLINWIESKCWQLLGKDHQWERTPSIAKWYAQEIGKQLTREKCDVLITKKGSIEISFLDTRIPIIYESDALFHSMINYYPGFFNPSARARSFGEDIERRALEKCKVFVAESDWAARSAIKDYNILKDKIRVFYSHAGLGFSLDRSLVLIKRPDDVCRLLFVGTEWERKGGEIAVDTINELNRSGVPSRLVVCGCYVPEQHKANPYIEEVGFINKSRLNGRAEYDALFLAAHFFLLPTRAECFGQVFVDACGFGLPIMATDTGGIAEAVQDNENGFCLSLASKGRDFALKIREVWEDKPRYEHMCMRSRELYEQKFSEEVWVEKMREVFESALK